jgi:hypothetical protein
VVLVPAHHEVDAVFVEQRHPFLADPEIRAIEFIDRCQAMGPGRLCRILLRPIR